ncbi:hypothetical protein TrRE_jg6002 [Triparma retinervis]|uniref:Uncharacterized protein n=1 Tax=Triparma retinervis TaxID=2557542 RepID=A0A9W7F617_9STRA|nr:hypothetical protein TrRE_jg6002 [Triparma retinervis]
MTHFYQPNMEYPYPDELETKQDYIDLVSTPDDPGVWDRGRVHEFITNPEHSDRSTSDQKWYLTLIHKIDAEGTPIAKKGKKSFKGERSHNMCDAAGGVARKNNLTLITCDKHMLRTLLECLTFPRVSWFRSAVKAMFMNFPDVSRGPIASRISAMQDELESQTTSHGGGLRSRRNRQPSLCDLIGESRLKAAEATSQRLLGSKLPQPVRDKISASLMGHPGSRKLKNFPSKTPAYWKARRAQQLAAHKRLRASRKAAGLTQVTIGGKQSWVDLSQGLVVMTKGFSQGGQGGKPKWVRVRRGLRRRG